MKYLFVELREQKDHLVVAFYGAESR